MLKAYKDVFGNVWFAAQLQKMPVKLDDGDYVLFNPEQGFAISLEHTLKDQYTYFSEYSNTSIAEMFPDGKFEGEIEGEIEVKKDTGQELS